uniref:Uncharacterized protein n=1 Tax=Lactuca sativa TaxID=4236 RepID=A0A9R1W8X2_LACSA|nr:hypothetical protein LSAT_V11C300109730 [Lactuca sativa]
MRIGNAVVGWLSVPLWASKENRHCSRVSRNKRERHQTQPEDLRNQTKPGDWRPDCRFLFSSTRFLGMEDLCGFSVSDSFLILCSSTD